MGTRWLDEDEQRTWRALLTTHRLLFDALDDQLQQDARLSLADYEVLSRLSEAPGRRLRMSELADAALFSPSRLSHAVSRLEAAGWVERVPCESDRRGFFAVLTDAGFAKLVDAAPGHVEAVRRHLLDPLTSGEIRRLGAILGKVGAGLDAAG